MQGNKKYQEKLFIIFQLSKVVPKNNFYRHLKDVLDLHFLYKLTKPYYGLCGHTQSTDSALIKANASMDSLELKVPEEELKAYLSQVRSISNGDKSTYENPVRKCKNDKATEEQKKVNATKQELNEISARHRKWKENQNTRQGAKSAKSKYTSNKTHYSPIDPDARISVKPGKARKLNYHGNITVDSSYNIISDVQAYHADSVDSKNLQDIVLRTKNRLYENGLFWQNILADAGYSSGVNYNFLERNNLVSYIPKHGRFKGGPKGFVFEKEKNYWLCPQGKKVIFRKQKLVNDSLQNHYYTTRKDCKYCL